MEKSVGVRGVMTDRQTDCAPAGSAITQFMAASALVRCSRLGHLECGK
jgi:hypothetical protein